MRELNDLVNTTVLLILGWGVILFAVKYTLEFLQR